MMPSPTTSNAPPASPNWLKHKAGSAQNSSHALRSIHENEMFSEQERTDNPLELCSKELPYSSTDNIVEMALEASEDMVDGGLMSDVAQTEDVEDATNATITVTQDLDYNDNSQVVIQATERKIPPPRPSQIPTQLEKKAAPPRPPQISAQAVPQQPPQIPTQSEKKTPPPRPPAPKRPLQMSKSLPIQQPDNINTSPVESDQPEISDNNNLTVPDKISPRTLPVTESAPDLTTGASQNAKIDETDADKQKKEKRRASLFNVFSRSSKKESSNSSNNLLVTQVSQVSDSGTSEPPTPLSKSSQLDVDLLSQLDPGEDCSSQEQSAEEMEMVASIQELQLLSPTGAPHPTKRSFVRRMSQKIKTSLLVKHSDEDSADYKYRKNKLEENRFEIIDLTMEEVPYEPPRRKINYLTHATIGRLAPNTHVCCTR